MTTTVRSNSPFLSTFPGRYYYDAAIFAEEQERIFGQMWFYVGRADALAAPGSYRVVTVANESIIRQDWVVCELTQKSMASRAYCNGGNYAPDEHHIRGFVEYVLEKLGH